MLCCSDMRLLWIAIAKVIGVLLMVAAFVVCISYDYPNVSPFAPGAVFAPSMIGQGLNWCLLAAGGYFLFTLGKKTSNTPDAKP